LRNNYLKIDNIIFWW